MIGADPSTNLYVNEADFSRVSPLHCSSPPPPPGSPICYVHGFWRNKNLMSGGIWILQGHLGDVFLHAREAFTSSSENQLLAELRTLLWCVVYLKFERLAL